MTSPFEIDGDDIAKLDDAALRKLIGQLCEADFRRAGLSTAAITWGGNQDAADGGLDVVVDSSEDPPKASFIPRRHTGFQVKKPDMTSAAIIKEMRPGGVLRPSIKALILNSGSYLIVSSTGSVTQKRLDDRRAAMRKAVEDEPGHEKLHLDFLDRGRVATWVRSHPFQVLWVLDQVGRSLPGWQPYGNWTNAPGGIEEEYLIDDRVRLHDGTPRGGARLADEGVSLLQGIARLRGILSSSGASVRLAGLSGVGKTHLVQALFDPRIGENALNPGWAFYTDLSDSPSPDPRTFAQRLIAHRDPAVLVIDNCPPDLHRRLTSACSGTNVSLITVEYDIRDDLPDETSVFRLEPASADLIFELVERRFPHVTRVDARTIAEFSGGNARIAIALANTVRIGQTLSGFHDDQLFEKLFEQRRGSSPDLMRSAEACSLVYSFDVSDPLHEASELRILAALAGKSVDDLYRDIRELQTRDLVQARGKWRAVLPQAIANRLAARVLTRIPHEKVVRTFLGTDMQRLIRSFTRRLNFLHDCEAAVEIVNDWLGDDGWVGQHIASLSPFGMEVFRNIAPVSPEKVLEAIERAASGPDGRRFTSRENGHFRYFVEVLRCLAYDRHLFHRSVRLIVRFALSEDIDERRDSIRGDLKSLFHLMLSGTLATPEERLLIIEELLESDQEASQQLGVALLGEALEAWHFTSSLGFGFGARPRSYGYQPQTHTDVEHWFATFITRCTRVAISNRSTAAAAASTLAEQFRGLCLKGGMISELDRTARAIHAVRPWHEGWIAVRQTIFFDRKDLDEATVSALEDLERHLRPTSLLEQARTYALSDRRSFSLDHLDDPEDPASARSRAEEIAREVGEKVARDPETLALLLPEVVRSKGHRVWSFGEGLAMGSIDKWPVWSSLRSHLAELPPNERRSAVFLGFLLGARLHDREFCERTLDSTLTDPVLGPWLPSFQAAVGIDGRGVERLHQALDADITPIGAFANLALGSNPDQFDDEQLARLLRRIAAKAGGVEVALDILQMRLHGLRGQAVPCGEALLRCGRDLLAVANFPAVTVANGDHDYALATVANRCLPGEAGRGTAELLCQRLRSSTDEYQVHTFEYPQLLKVIAKYHPSTLLDTFLVGHAGRRNWRRKVFDDFGLPTNPTGRMPDEIILAWCVLDPGTRYARILAEIPLCSMPSDAAEPTWRPVVLKILDRMPDLSAAFNSLLDAIEPTSWSGSRADIMQRRLPLLDQLLELENAEIAGWARSMRPLIEDQIRREREEEDARSREQDERFE